ncbi:MAG: hypothetical protein JEZ00_04065 [Anaerolineaceae bacterium]|nr:hypothetical protein [Anaerolineaceae bacterium]
MPSFRKIIITGVSLGLLGIGGIIFLIYFTKPTLQFRWLFFFLSLIGFSGFSLPILGLIHQRFSPPESINESVLLRESIMIGFFANLLAWLMIGDMLTFALFLLLLAGVVTIEYLIRLTEKSQWRPNRE